MRLGPGARPGVRGKLFGVSVLLVVAVGAVVGVWLEGELRELVEGHVGSQLDHGVAAARDALEEAGGPMDARRADALADRLGASLASRVTVIAHTGEVLGDSSLALPEVQGMDDHTYRPEFAEALEHGVGTARRWSTTLGTQMVYRAEVFARPELPGGRGVVRVATPLGEVEQAVRALRLMLVVVGIVGLLLAVCMSALAAHLAARALGRLVERARHLVTGAVRGERLEVATSDELGLLAGSFNRLAEELERSVGTVAGERARLDAILEGMREAVLALDSRRRVTLANRAALRMLGLAESPVGKALVEVVREPDIATMVEAGEQAERELELAGQPPRQVHARLAPLPLTDGSVLVMRDITDKRRLERMRRDFVANVSHELRTPVAVIRANAETLAGGAMDDPVHGPRFVEAIERNADRLRALVDDLLDLSRIEAGQLELNPQPMALARVARRVVESVRRPGESIDREVLVEVPDGLTVLADERSLHHVLTNLVDNAFKYTPAEREVWVRARLQPDGFVRLEVADDGPGIEARHRSRIFERFYRVDGHRNRGVGGTGLGLAIVKHLAEANGGRVGCEPNHPRGTVFWVALPPGEGGGVGAQAPALGAGTA